MSGLSFCRKCFGSGECGLRSATGSWSLSGALFHSKHRYCAQPCSFPVSTLTKSVVFSHCSNKQRKASGLDPDTISSFAEGMNRSTSVDAVTAFNTTDTSPASKSVSPAATVIAQQEDKPKAGTPRGAVAELRQPLIRHPSGSSKIQTSTAFHNRGLPSPLIGMSAPGSASPSHVNLHDQVAVTVLIVTLLS